MCKTPWKMGGRKKECSFCLYIYKETRGNTQKNLRQWLLVGIGMWGLGRWQTATGGRLLLQIFSHSWIFWLQEYITRIFFFFFKQRRDMVFICFLENSFLLRDRGCTQEGGEQWGEKKGVPLPEKTSINLTWSSLNPDTARIREGG